MRGHCLVAALVVSMLYKPVAAINVDSLLVESIGGPSARDSVVAMQSIFYRGTAVMGGIEGNLTAWAVPPNKYLLQFKSEAINLTRGCDGKVVWERDQNGRVFDLAGFEKEVILKSAYFESYAYVDPKRRMGSRSYLGVHDLGYHKYNVVQLVPTADDTTWMYIDTQTGLCDVTETIADELLITTTMADYRSVGGILVPFFIRDTVNGLGGSSTVILEQVDINLAVDPVIFERPGMEKVDFHFPADVASVTIPFAFVESHIFVKATLNGKLTVYLLLDSGASVNIYYKPTVENLELPITGYIPVQGVAADDSIGLVMIDSVQIGELALYHQVAGMMDESPIGQATMENADFGGALGFDFLSRFPMKVDYTKFELTVYNPQKFELPKGGTEVPFFLSSKIPMVPAKVSGIEGNFLVDLGNAIGLILNEDFVTSHNLTDRLAEIHDLEGGMLGVGGMATMRGATAKSVVLGGLELGQTQVFLPESAGGMSSSKRIDGNIGNPVLKQFTVLLDYERNRLVLYPPAGQNSSAN